MWVLDEDRRTFPGDVVYWLWHTDAPEVKYWHMNKAYALRCRDAGLSPTMDGWQWHEARHG